MHHFTTIDWFIRLFILAWRHLMFWFGFSVIPKYGEKKNWNELTLQQQSKCVERKTTCYKLLLFRSLSNWRNLISAEAYMVCLTLATLCQPVCVYLSFLRFVLFCIRIVFAEGCRHRQSHHFRIFFKKSICSSIGWFEKKETVIIFGSPRSPFYFDFHLIKYLFSLIEQNNVIFSHEYNDDNSINGIIRM